MLRKDGEADRTRRGHSYFGDRENEKRATGAHDPGRKPQPRSPEHAKEFSLKEYERHFAKKIRAQEAYWDQGLATASALTARFDSMTMRGIVDLKEMVAQARVAEGLVELL